ncbi:glycoside hydrolase family 5 protein [Labrenzia sp. CE80]|uniref:glycoside hydrolase family 5 protein n=1 Tax=Labrenzia sp. CE80 TaxID=1788986 RepID=UPI001930E67E|nr:glycoside hydrolase family 5 protein [Labrenzia sp. CE80]
MMSNSRRRIPDPRVLSVLAGSIFWGITTMSVWAEDTGLCFRGVNISGAEYGDASGVYGTNYIYPSEKTVRYFADKGMNIVRLPFKWERLQPVLREKLDQEELTKLRGAVELIRANGMKIILDPHNFGYYDGKRLMTEGLTSVSFADFWVRLALEFANDEDIIFGLMNEPYDIPAPDWLVAANRAIAGIRAAGAKNLILVPGTIWSGASSWEHDIPGGANGTVMAGVLDPDANFAYEVHQYLDEDLSGTHETCPNAELANDALQNFSRWLKEHDARGFLGEFGGSKDSACLTGLAAMVETMNMSPDLWLGWTYWAAGDWWPESEGNNIQPTEAGDRPQLSAVLQPRFEAEGQNCSTLN